MSYQRLTSDNTAVLFIDHQTGLANGVQTQKLPSIITTSAADYGRPYIVAAGRRTR